MSSCSIFNKPVILDTTNLDSASIDISWLKSLIPDFNTDFSGIWRPVLIKDINSTAEYGEPLMRARFGPTPSFTPCDCSDNSINPRNINEEISEYNICSYCGNYSTEWRLYDTEGNSSARSYEANCCSGACDTRFKTDDYIPKIPVLNQSYLTGVCDFKYHQQFPACSNPGLGKERFITISSSNRSKILGPELCVDWKLKESISEIKYDALYSHHDSEYLHNKSYEKSKIVSKTCGNFVLLSIPEGTWYQSNYPILSGLIGSTIANDTPSSVVPTVEQFSNLPYGIDQEKYKNIFIKNQKLGSFWKWNYQSGVLCWYRYFDKDRPSNLETRPIPGVDLYISPGDVFFATNDGPEPQGDTNNPNTINGIISSCPSGLKITDSSELKCIIPSGSEFCYISANIYSRFHRIYSILNTRLSSYINAFKTAAILSTSPAYDEITVDLLKENTSYKYDKNEFQQLDILNKHMQQTTTYDSVSRLNYISNKEELVNTLANKYGAYLWIPPNTESNITFNQSINSSFAIDLDFDMVIKKEDRNWLSNSCNPIRGCYERSLTKSYSYSQKIGFANAMLSTSINDDIRYINSCNSTDGTITSTNHGIFSSIYINDSKIKSIFTSSGCIFFEDIYPRISDEDSSGSCADCDTYSSFYLIPDAESVECGNHNENDSFCYSTLAKRFNNSPKQFPTDTQKRKERYIKDGTIRLKRGYKSLFFNPHIDVIAFHQQGGIFFSSVPFGLDSFTAFEKNSSFSAINTNQITINFKTNNVGIKLYSLGAEYLQTNNSRTNKCKRFPVKNSCQCLPISISQTLPISCSNPLPSTINSSNVFTPSLSTSFTPTLQKYGGYNQSYLNSIFEIGTLTAGGTLPGLSTKIDPINPYGCDSTTSITLYNYTNSSWNIQLNKFTTKHADIYVQAYENINLLAKRYQSYFNEFYTEKRPNNEFKRFTTKTTIQTPDGDKNIYANQNILLYNKDISIPSTINVKLQNPFLQSLLAAYGDQDAILYPPSGKLLNNYIFNKHTTSNGDLHRGDEVSSVTLSFNQKYRKQVLNFVIPPPKAMGTLNKGFFHPNSGLVSDIQNKSPLKNGKIYYDNPLSDSNSIDNFDDGFCLYGTFNQRMLNTIRSINSFNNHKKLRLYLFINNKWYEYNNPNTGGYTVNNNIYIGKPIIYEYLSNKNKSQNLPSVLPSIPKKHVNFDYVYNHYNYEKTKSKPIFPLTNNTFTYNTNDPKKIFIQGVRHYFMVPEIDPAIDTGLDSIDNIESFEAEEGTITFGKTIKFNDGTHWLCIDPSNLKLRASYIWSDFDYINHLFSDMHLDYTKLSKTGYLYNSSKPCSWSFSTYDPKNKIWDTANTIINKQIMVRLVTSNGIPVTNLTKDDIYMIPYTVFDLSLPIRNLNYSVIDLLHSNNTDDFKNFHSFILSSITCPVSENDSRLMNRLIPSKWGDVVNYDGEVVNDYTLTFLDLDKVYPSATYNNDFYKIIVNNHAKEKHLYKVYYSGTNSTTISHNNLTYYSILQKYNIGDNTPYSIQDKKYHNYLPFIDLNILTSGNNLEENSEDFKEILKNSIKDQFDITGIMNISGILNNVSFFDGVIDPNSNPSYFWINFDNSNSSAKSTFVPASTFYSDSLRIDDPAYWLSSTSKNTIDIPLSGFSCRETFEPRGLDAYTATTTKFDNSSSYNLVSSTRNNPYFKYPIYCDTDDNTCDNSGCFKDNHPGIAQTAWVTLKSNYKIATDTTTSIPDSVPFMLSYDAGIYNVIGNDSYIYIKRFELSPNNQIEFTSGNCDINSRVFPNNYSSKVINPIYQQTLQQTDNTTHDQIITDTDLVANEMLFRILYGEKQFINKEMLYTNNTILTKNDLIKYSDPKITSKDIYDQILYNFDKSAEMRNFNINGAFVVRGVATVGSTTTINIGDKTAVFRVIRDNGKIYTSGIIGEKSISAPIYTEYTEDKTYLIQTWGRGDNTPPPPSAPDENTTITYLGQCNLKNRYTYNLIATSDYGWVGEITPASFGETATLRVSQPSYKYATADMSVGGGGGDGSACACISSKTWLEPYSRPQWVCGEPSYGGVSLVPPVITGINYNCTSSPMGFPNGGGQCTEFEVGYCRKTNCPTCADTIVSEDYKEFSYDFEYCRTKLTLFGHAYRQINRNLPLSRIAERPPTCGPDGCIDYPIVQSVAEYEKIAINTSFAGIVPVLTADDQGNIVSKCTKIYGAIPKCTSDSNTCISCGCDDAAILGVAPNCALKDCAFCYVGSYFLQPEQGYYPTPIRRAFLCGPIVAQADYCKDNKDFCGVAKAGDRDVSTYRNIYLQSVRNNNQPYNPLCATDLVSISYTNKSLTFFIGSESLCIDFNPTSCPTINITSNMGQLSVSDTVSSNCGLCSSNSTQITVPSQSQQFLTIREKRKCIIGYKYVNSVNPNGLTGYYDSWGFCDKGGGQFSFQHQCGTGDPVEYGCLEFGQLISTWEENFMPMSIECNIGLPGDMPQAVAAYEIPEWAWELGERYKSRYTYLGKGSSHIPTQDIIEGIVPGTVSDIKVESYNLGGYKTDRVLNITGDVLTVYVAYYEYDYIRPATLNDILRNDESVLCSNGAETSSNTREVLLNNISNSTTAVAYSLGHCAAIPFPPSYASNFTQSQADRFYYYNNGSVMGSSYTVVNPSFKQDKSCDSAISCYYKHNVFVCPDDKCCFADLGVVDNKGVCCGETAFKNACSQTPVYGNPSQL